MNDKGVPGEDAAVKYLKKHGYRILERNFPSRFGEIDIVAQKDGFLVFCEVKARKPNALVGGLESVDWHKQQRLIKTAQYYLSRKRTDLQPRFDVISLVGEDGRYTVADHIINAF